MQCVFIGALSRRQMGSCNQSEKDAIFGRDSYERKLSNHHDQGRRQGATAIIEFFSVMHTSKNFEGAKGRLCSSKGGGRLCHGTMALWPVQAWQYSPVSIRNRTSSMTSPNINRFSKFLYQLTQQCSVAHLNQSWGGTCPCCPPPPVPVPLREFLSKSINASASAFISSIWLQQCLRASLKTALDLSYFQIKHPF